MKHLSIFLLVIILSACSLTSGSPMVFKNKMFYGKWWPVSETVLSGGIMTITPTQVLYKESIHDPVYDCRLVDQTNDAIMLECYADVKWLKEGRVYKIFRTRNKHRLLEQYFYITLESCLPDAYKTSTPSLSTPKRFCGLSTYSRIIDPKDQPKP